MVTPRKAITPKKSIETKKPSSKAITPKKTQETKKSITKKTPETKKPGTNKTISNKKNQTSNGNVSDSDVEEFPSSSSESLKDSKQNGAKISKTPTPKSKKSNQKRKRRHEEEEVEEKEEVKSYTFPMERVKRIIRSEDSEMRISHDAVFLVNKATEKFLGKFCEDAHACCVKDRKRSLAYKHLSSVVSKRKRYDFLSDYVPEKVKAEDALAKRKLAEAKRTRSFRTC